MGRARFNKRDHVEKINRLFESRNKRSVITEQLGTNGFGCDLSCVDISDSTTDGMVAQGGGPNSIQPYDPSATYAPGSVVCNLDPGTNVTNIFVASANSGQLVPGGGIYPEPEEGVTAFSWPLPPGTPTSSYYWEPGVITMACGGNVTSGTTSGDWWCDPTGQYVSPTGSPCLQSATQPQSYFTGPSSTEQDCIAQCGTTGAQEYVCMGGVMGPVGTNSCIGPHPVGTYQMGAPNVMGIYPTQADCDVACNGIMCDPPPGGCPQGEIWMSVPICACQTDPNTGTACDISWNTPCAQQHLLTGAQNSWTNFLNLRQTGFDSVGCQHLQQLVNWTTNQLNSGVTGANSANPGTPLSPVQISRKTEQLAWAQCQANECGCSPLNAPPLTGGNTPTGNNSHESFTGTVCACVGDCSSPSGQIGVGFQAGSATHQCNGQMCDQNDIGQIFDYDDGTKTLTFTLNSFSTPGIFGVSQTPGINMPSATCPTGPAGPPVDPDLIDPEAPLKQQSVKQEPVKQKPVNPLFEEFNRMKDMWKYKI